MKRWLVIYYEDLATMVQATYSLMALNSTDAENKFRQRNIAKKENIVDIIQA